MEVDFVPKKRSCKQNLICLGGYSGGKVVLKLMTEVIALHIALIIVDIRRLSLKFGPGWIVFWGLGLENRLDNLIQVILYVSCNIHFKNFGAWGGLTGASRGPSLFDPKGFLWSLLSDLWDEGLIEDLEAWLLCIGRSLSRLKHLL